MESGDSLPHCQSKGDGDSEWKGFLPRGLWDHRHLPLYPLVSMCGSSLNFTQRRDPTVVPTQLSPALGQSESPCPEYLWKGSSATEPSAGISQRNFGGALRLQIRLLCLGLGVP